jgi:VWFA-related protein
MKWHDSQLIARIAPAVSAAALGALFLYASGPLSVAGQQASANVGGVQTLKVTTEVVNVYSIVREKKGRLISNLKAPDFQVFEDGVQQEIRYFSRETDTPLTMGILIDTSPSQVRVLGVEQQEADRFLRQVLRPKKDLVCVIQFDMEVELIQDFTDNLSYLARAIDSTVIHGDVSGPLPSPLPTSSVGGTHLYDAVYLAATEMMKGQVGRKVIILLSDGVDQGSTIERDRAIEAAQKADLIIYSIDVSDPSFYWRRGGGFGGSSSLKKFSEETGGRVIHVDRPEKTAAAFQELADELRTQYLLGYSPTNTRHDGAFRKIRVKVRGGNYKIQARNGYYAPTQ